MSGYLQRLLDGALPASAAALTPVVKSTSPVFERNQLLGLTDLHAGDAETELAPPPAAAVPSTSVVSAAMPVPQVAATAPIPAITPPDPRPVTRAVWQGAELGHPMAVEPVPPRRPVATATMPGRREAPDTVVEPMPPDPEVFESTPRLDAAPAPSPEPGTELTPPPAPSKAILARGEIAQVATAATVVIGSEATARADTEPRPAAPHVVIRDAPRDLEPIEGAADAPVPPRDVEPRPRPDFGDAADPDEPRPESRPSPPRITIGRVMVEVVPDRAPAAKLPLAPRTAAAASMIGPLGNRRARRRLFVLSRL